MSFLLLPLIWLAVLAPAVVVVVTACRVPRWAWVRGGCGKCGYEVGLNATCPECGCDVLTVGVASVRLAMRSRPGLGAACVAWAVISLYLIGLSAGLVGSMVVGRTTGSLGCRITTFGVFTAGGEDAATVATYRLHTIRRTLTSFGGNATEDTLTLVIDPAGALSAADFGTYGDIPVAGATRMMMFSAGGRYIILDAAGKKMDEGSPFDDAAAKRLLGAAEGTEMAGPDLESKVMAGVLDALPDLVNTEMQIPGGASPAGAAGFSPGFTVLASAVANKPIGAAVGPGTIILVAATGWIVTTLAGSFAIWARRRGLLRRAEGLMSAGASQGGMT